jgi:hypothetical protein
MLDIEDLYKKMSGVDDNAKATDKYKGMVTQARRLGYKLLAYQMAGADVDDFMKSDVWMSSGDKLSEDVKYRYLEEWIKTEKSPDKGVPSRKLSDSLKLARLNSWAHSAENNENSTAVKNLVREFIGKWNKDVNKDGRIGFAEGLKDMWKNMQNDEGTTQEQRDAFVHMDTKIKEIERSSSTGISWQDRLIDVLESINRFMSNIKSVTFNEGVSRGG